MLLAAEAAGLGVLTWICFLLWERYGSRSRKEPEGVTDEAKPAFLQDYASYRLSTTEYLLSLSLALFLMFIVGIIFFKSVLFAVVISVSGFAYPRLRAKQLRDRRKEKLSLQFKQMLYSLSSSLSAGRSVESAFLEAAADLSALYPSSDTFIRVEVERINLLVANGENLEAALREFAHRTQIEDIQSFCEVFAAGKRSGVNLVEVIRRTANMIADKLEVQQEISVLVAQKKFESKVLALSPLLIIALLSFSSADYMAPLYSGLWGPAIMAFSLLCLTASFLLAQKIMDIRV